MTTPALLPLSGRRLPPLNLGASAFPHHRATLRLSEKFILLLILSAFITLCFGAFFFLPDSSKHKRFDLGLEDVLIPHVDTSKGGKNLGGFLIHGQGHDEHRHREEEERLRNKIRADHEKALEEAKEKLKKSRDEIQAEIQTEKNKVVQELKKKESKPLPPVPLPNLIGINSGEPADPDIREKRNKIKEVSRVLVVTEKVRLEQERRTCSGRGSSEGILQQAVYICTSRSHDGMYPGLLREQTVVIEEDLANYRLVSFTLIPVKMMEQLILEAIPRPMNNNK
ncbi:PREDICTED: mannosyl-oligosaccharide 1,2-alpha-mannosidase IB-like, partial [Mesitornis unicolor]|uniref:mannosyl-oligosaccharide 1,2-alpha-mannosidase IB-like n=1 Tax=Mesitornis unicolor TaxID=54374 RepID=UPI000528043E